jgi:hypothetical protein
MCNALVSVFLLLSGAAGGHAGIVLHLLNGKTGKPVQNEHLVIFQGDSPEQVRRLGTPYETRTDPSGNALLPAGIMPWFSVHVDWHVVCEAQGSQSPIYSTEELKRKGLIGPNRCGSTTRTATANEIYLFVRDETFVEKMRH